MVRNIFLILIFVSLCNSCNAQKCKAKVLLNGKTKAPVYSDECFNSKKYTPIKTLEGINTQYVYEEISKRSDGWYSVLVIYPSGKINYFSFKNNTVYNIDSFNPSIHGLRGVLMQNIKSKEFYIRYYTIINHSGDWGIKEKKINVNEDEIQLIDEKGYSTVYKKKEVPKEFLSHKSDW